MPSNPRTPSHDCKEEFALQPVENFSHSLWKTHRQAIMAHLLGRLAAVNPQTQITRHGWRRHGKD